VIKVRPSTRLLLGGALSGSCAGVAWPLLARAAGGGVGLADVALWAGAGALCGPLIAWACLVIQRRLAKWRLAVVLGGALSGALSAFVLYASTHRGDSESMDALVVRSGLGLVMGVVITLCLLPQLKRLDRRPVDAPGCSSGAALQESRSNGLRSRSGMRSCW